MRPQAIIGDFGENANLHKRDEDQGEMLVRSRGLATTSGSHGAKVCSPSQQA